MGVSMYKLAARLVTMMLLAVPHAGWAQDASVGVAAGRQVVLGSGEVLAQVLASGVVRTRPDLARFRVTVRQQGLTSVAARAAADVTIREVTAKLVAIGLDPAAVRVMPGGEVRMGFIGNEGYGDDDVDSPAINPAFAAMIAQRKGMVTVTLQVTVADMAKLDAVRTLLYAQDGATSSPPSFSLRDNQPARRAAIANAVAKGRQDADAYAAALGMRVVRVVRIYNQSATDQEQSVKNLLGSMYGVGDHVVTEVRLGLELILAAR